VLVLVLAAVAGLATLIGGRMARTCFAGVAEAAALAGSVAVAAALFEVIPDVATSFDPRSRLGGLIAIGFFGYFLGERLLYLHVREGGFGPAHVFHGFVDGLALGLSFKLGVLTGVAVFLAVASHQFAHAVASARAASQLSDARGMLAIPSALFRDAAAPLLGTLVTIALEPSDRAVVYLLAVYAGVLLFAGVNDLRQARLPRHAAFVCGGFAAVFSLALMHGM
jgi:zinc transporter ZupT